MISQIFKNNIPIELLINLFKNIAIKLNDCYIINKQTYKKGIFTQEIATFVEACKPFYYLSKQKYTKLPITYNSFITIIRQICNINNIKYISKIKYDKSSYDIVYSVYLV
jgi:hypothetical protein